MMSTKQVKVDNWGIFFLQRLKHFFNRTDYCDLTLQFQDNAQLKVHRLVLNACTEYFELLERTCEMYEDCLIMPEDLQADVVVPIVNFMYTGQLEYKSHLFDRLFATAQIMNMSVLTKLLGSQKANKSHSKNLSTYGKSDSPVTVTSNQKYVANRKYGPSSGIANRDLKIPSAQTAPTRKRQAAVREGPKPTRYELPEELDADDIFEPSFADISYESRPLMLHPKREFSIKDENMLFSEASSSRSYDSYQSNRKRQSSSLEMTVAKKSMVTNQSHDLVCERNNDFLGNNSNEDPFDSISSQCMIEETPGDNIFDQTETKLTFKSNQEASSVNHAKIISEVLKKYPHLVKNNKNIKLRIMSPSQNKQNVNDQKIPTKRMGVSSQVKDTQMKPFKKIHQQEENKRDWNYVSDIVDTKEIGKLVAMGVENIKGPWLCLICGTPGKALNFLSYYKYRQHLSDVHKEPSPLNMCEHCGFKSGKRNHLYHHLYSKHGITPPPSYHFPKCNQCNYIALTEAFLIKHKISHNESREFSCNVCLKAFKSTAHLLSHIQTSGHKISPDKKSNVCLYCQKVFLRVSNLYTHLKTAHKEEARSDGIIDNSDDEQDLKEMQSIKYEDDEQSDDEHMQIEQQSDGAIQIVTKMQSVSKKPQIQKILNSGLKRRMESSLPKFVKKKPAGRANILHEEIESEDDGESTVLISSDPSGNLNNRIVMVNQNEIIFKSEDPQVNTIQSSEMESEEFEFSDVLDGDYSEMSSVTLSQQEIDNSINQKNKPTQVYLQSSKFSQYSQPIVTGQTFVKQIVVSDDKQYPALVTSASSLILNEVTPSKSLVSLPSNLTLNPSQNRELMIIQQNYNPSQAITSDASNIVVVYSNNATTENSLLAAYSQAQITTDPNITQIDNSIANTLVQGENLIVDSGIATQILGQDLVHETVETWDGDTIQSEQILDNDPTQNITSEVVEIIHDTSSENIVSTSHESFKSNPSILVSIDPNQEIANNRSCPTHSQSSQPEITHSIESSRRKLLPSENLVNVKESDVTQDTPSTLIENLDSINTSQIQEISEENNSYTNDNEECSTLTNDSNTDKLNVASNVNEHVESLASEWSDDEIHETTANYKCSKNDSEQIEESIENIRDEVLRNENHKNEDVLIENSNGKVGSKEKISSLLNDWEDNDSQAEAPQETLQPTNSDAQALALEWENGDNVKTS